MKALILAAGVGRRMAPLTDITHKTLLQVGGEYIIDRLIRGLVENGIVNVCLVTGYRADELESHVVKAFPDVDFEFIRNERHATTNNIYSLALAFEQLTFDDDLIMLESDLIYEPAVLARLLDSPHENVALVDHYRIGLDGTVVSVNSSNIISAVIPGSMQGPDFDFSQKFKTLNIYKFSAQFCEEVFSRLLTYYAKIIDNNVYYELILGVLIYMQRVHIHAETLDGELWAEVDDPNDLRVAEYLFNPESRLDYLDNSWGGYWNLPVTDFAFIRNMHFPSDSAVSQMKAYLPHLMFNYGSSQKLLNQKIATFVKCMSENIYFLNGASQFFRPFLERMFDDSEVLLPSPTFGEYNACFPNARNYSDDGTIHLGDVASQVGDARLIVVVNPNNPTGSTVPTDDLVTLARQFPDRLLLVDESFIDFSGQPSIVPQVEDLGLDNVVVLKSLSKALGVPGVRIGYVHTRNQLVKAVLDHDLPVWNANSMAEYFVELLLKYPTELSQSFEKTIADREEFAGLLRDLPVVQRVYPSGANFLLAELRLSDSGLLTLRKQLLREHGIYIKGVSQKFDDGVTRIRLAVRTRQENRLLTHALGIFCPEQVATAAG
ncbi:MAG: aminotransferase class I/II-fold pyridoxal phosphate-dependent enzyme [Pseudonocardia sp.]|nr:aminotransferase class I/II-fold pyridoxal phosphate-dependent enzyme [Pseudonocardia sp.]